jgi:ABC-type branched-subunit amino acid transport system substrate-binding protein
MLRALALLGFGLALPLALGACQPLPPPKPIAAVPPPNPHVAVLVPLTGPRADIGTALSRGAQIGLEGGPALDVRDTGGTAEGAARAAQDAVTGGDLLILGPLTSAETAAVAGIAAPAGIGVLAFTNDSTQARPGVWTLGITPGQQVRRLLAAVQAQGKTRIAALLPSNDFGRATDEALRAAAVQLNLPAPTIRTYGGDAPSIEQGLGDIAAATPEALLLADTGPALSQIANLLPKAGIERANVRILGPALWAGNRTATLLFAGAWYAAPDAATRGGFDRLYRARFGTPAPALADLAYDAAAIARAAGAGPGFSPAALAAAPYNGVDGPLALGPDGRVQRGLAVFELRSGGPLLVAPTPPVAGAPGS